MADVSFASKAAADLAAEMGVDPRTITRTGSGGRVTVADVRRAGPPDPPEGLDVAGRALWTSILGDLPGTHEFNARELDLLERASRQADDVARCEAIVDRDGPAAKGSAGQPVVSPHLLEARQGRLAIARLLGAIELPGEADEPLSEASLRGKKAAAARWNRRDQIVERRRAAAERSRNGTA